MSDRPELSKLLDIVQPGDTICCTEVSRLSRSTKDFCSLIDFVKTNKLKLIAGTLVFDCTQDTLDPAQQMMMQVVSVFAEFERNMISERTKSGLAAKKAQGVKLGRPELTREDLPVDFIKKYPLYKNGDLNITEMARLLKVSRNTIYKYIALMEGK